MEREPGRDPGSHRQRQGPRPGSAGEVRSGPIARGYGPRGSRCRRGRTRDHRDRAHLPRHGRPGGRGAPHDRGRAARVGPCGLLLPPPGRHPAGDDARTGGALGRHLSGPAHPASARRRPPAAGGLGSGSSDNLHSQAARRADRPATRRHDRHRVRGGERSRGAVLEHRANRRVTLT